MGTKTALIGDVRSYLSQLIEGRHIGAGTEALPLRIFEEKLTKSIAPISLIFIIVETTLSVEIFALNSLV